MKKRIWIPVVSVIAVIVIAYLGIGYVVYDKLAKTTKRPGGWCEPSHTNSPATFASAPEADWPDIDYTPYYMPNYQTVSLPSRQPNLTISGWYVEADPTAPVVILFDGIGGCKYTQSTLLPAGMLHHSGINVLLIDLRDQGDSSYEDGRTDLGNEEYQDVLGAWDWLVSTKGYDPQRVGIYGASLGTLAAMTAFAQEPRVAAMFLQAPISSLTEIAQEELARSHMPGFLFAGARMAALLVSRDDLLAHEPKDAMLKAGERPMFIVHSRVDPRIDYHHSERLAQMAKDAGANVTLWLVDKGGHLMAPAYYGQEFEDKMAGFFRSALGK
jgi:dipeptidyl aminopeptidase/acylaminoacyl peptidase